MLTRSLPERSRIFACVFLDQENLARFRMDETVPMVYAWVNGH